MKSVQNLSEILKKFLFYTNLKYKAILKMIFERKKFVHRLKNRTSNYNKPMFFSFKNGPTDYNKNVDIKCNAHKMILE